MWFTIYHNINGNNISQGITSAYKYGITSAIKKSKFIRHILTDILPCVYKIIKINMFFRPEEAMFGNWQKFVSLLKNFVLFLRKPKLQKDSIPEP